MPAPYLNAQAGCIRVSGLIRREPIIFITLDTFAGEIAKSLVLIIHASALAIGMTFSAMVGAIENHSIANSGRTSYR